MLPHAAHELFLTGEVFDAARAAAIGLVNSAVPAEQLDAEVRRYVDALLLAAPGAVASTKQLLRSSIADELSRLGTLSAASFAGDEARRACWPSPRSAPTVGSAQRGPADGRSS